MAAGVPGGRHLPHVLDRAAAQDPPEVQLTGHGRGRPVAVRPVPFDIPGPDEAPEEAEVLRVPGIRARCVQGGGKVIKGPEAAPGSLFMRSTYATPVSGRHVFPAGRPEGTIGR